MHTAAYFQPQLRQKVGQAQGSVPEPENSEINILQQILAQRTQTIKACDHWRTEDKGLVVTEHQRLGQISCPVFVSTTPSLSKAI